jgi:tetraacyldisaccharide 4'-kinase
VGDESLLLAALAPTWIGRDRAASARAAIAAGAGMLLLDDGYQNPTLAKDMSVVVVDGGYGFGNGHLIPAGPLRETLEQGLARAHAVVVIDRDDRHVAEQVAAVRPDLPLLRARYSAGPEADLLRGRKVVAFSGIARPEKFFATLRALGCEIVQEHSFPDHYLFTEREINRLKGRAKAFDALLVTTTKDAVRLTPEERDGIDVLTIVLRWEDPSAVDALLAGIGA